MSSAATRAARRNPVPILILLSSLQGVDEADAELICNAITVKDLYHSTAAPMNSDAVLLVVRR
jgi:hypothetical protein